jgi:hypothetical protein
MTFDTFVSRVDNLVWKWCPAHGDSKTPREELRKIYDDVGEQAVHNVAQTIEQRGRELERRRVEKIIRETK